MTLSGCAGQPGMLTTGSPADDFQFQPRWSATPMAPVGLFFIAGMPPNVAQLPTATTAAAFGARRSSHSDVVIGCPVSGLSPIAAQ